MYNNTTTHRIMALFNILLCKILYPKNTNNEMKEIFKPCTTFSTQDFYTKKSEPFDIVYKNPNYANIIFIVYNNFLFYSEYAEDICTQMVDENHIQSKKLYNTVSKKYQFLKKNLDNRIVNIDNEIIDIFRTTQKYYNIFARLAHRWRHKKAKIQIEHDLYMTPLDRNNINVFTLLQQGNIYLFTASNLVSSINSSLMNAPNFFVEPLVLKNPYTNVPFNKSDLYNIYFFLKKAPILMPILFHNFFLTNFHLSVFQYENENTIRNMYIKSVIRNSTPDALFVCIRRMLQIYQPKIIIDKDFPKDMLTSIMKPYLELYYIIKYSMEEYRIHESKKHLVYKLNKLYKYNPTFGRKTVQLTRDVLSNKMTKHTLFSNNYIPFDEPMDTNMYHMSHIELIEPNYSIYNDPSETYESDTEPENILYYSPNYTRYDSTSSQPTANNINNPLPVEENIPEYIADDEETVDDESDEIVIENSSQNNEDASDASDVSDVSDDDEDV